MAKKSITKTKKIVLKDLVQKAKEASKYAYSPYSKVSIGAALVDEKNRIFTGANIENASFGATICAERVAIFKAISEGSKKIKKICIYSKVGFFPCGICRQVLLEFADKNLEIYIAYATTSKKFSLKKLMPHAFTAKDLKGK